MLCSDSVQRLIKRYSMYSLKTMISSSPEILLTIEDPIGCILMVLLLGPALGMFRELKFYGQ